MIAREFARLPQPDSSPARPPQDAAERDSSAPGFRRLAVHDEPLVVGDPRHAAPADRRRLRVAGLAVASGCRAGAVDRARPAQGRQRALREGRADHPAARRDDTAVAGERRASVCDGALVRGFARAARVHLQCGARRPLRGARRRRGGGPVDPGHDRARRRATAHPAAGRDGPRVVRRRQGGVGARARRGPESQLPHDAHPCRYSAQPKRPEGPARCRSRECGTSDQRRHERQPGREAGGR